MCKSCGTCFMFYCMFYITCDRSFNAADTQATTVQTAAPVLVELPLSIGDHSSPPRRPASLPTPRQGDEQGNADRRPVSDRRDGGFQIPAADAAFLPATNKDTNDSVRDVDDLSRIASPSRNGSAAPKDHSCNKRLRTFFTYFLSKNAFLTLKNCPTFFIFKMLKSQCENNVNLKYLYTKSEKIKVLPIR